MQKGKEIHIAAKKDVSADMFHLLKSDLRKGNV